MLTKYYMDILTNKGWEVLERDYAAGFAYRKFIGCEKKPETYETDIPKEYKPVIESFARQIFSDQETHHMCPEWDNARQLYQALLAVDEDKKVTVHFRRNGQVYAFPQKCSYIRAELEGLHRMSAGPSRGIWIIDYDGTKFWRPFPAILKVMKGRTVLYERPQTQTEQPPKQRRKKL